MAQSIAVAELVTAVASYVTPANDAQHVLVATGEGNIQQLMFHSTQSVGLDLFAHVDDAILSGLAGYVTADGVQHAIAITMDGYVYHLSAGQQQIVAQLEDVMLSSVAAYAGTDGAQYAVIASSDGDVYHLAIQPGQTATPQKLGNFESGVISIAGYVVPADEKQHVFVASSDGNIQHFVLAGQNVVAQSLLGFFEESFISLTSYVTPADGLLHIIPATRDGKLYHVIYDLQLGQEVNIDVRDGVLFHDLAKTPGVSVEILIRFFKLTDSEMMSTAGYVTADGKQHVIVVSADGHVNYLSFQGRPQKLEDVTYEIIAEFAALY